MKTQKPYIDTGIAIKSELPNMSKFKTQTFYGGFTVLDLEPKHKLKGYNEYGEHPEIIKVLFFGTKASNTAVFKYAANLEILGGATSKGQGINREKDAFDNAIKNMGFCNITSAFQRDGMKRALRQMAECEGVKKIQIIEIRM